MPSICDWANAEVPQDVQGVSVRSIAESGNPQKEHQPYVVTETFLHKPEVLAVGWYVHPIINMYYTKPARTAKCFMT